MLFSVRNMLEKARECRIMVATLVSNSIYPCFFIVKYLSFDNTLMDNIQQIADAVQKGL